MRQSILLLPLLAACAGDLPGKCDDPGSFTIDCVDTEGSTLDHLEGSCTDYAESGDQLFASTESTCQKEDPGCVCTKDVSECTFPCGQND